MSNQPRNEKLCFIYAVNYATGKKHIAKVKAQVTETAEVPPIKIYTKNDILKLNDSGFRIVTTIKRGTKYGFGADVDVYLLKGVRFLKTEPNDREEDNLGELPTF